MKPDSTSLRFVMAAALLALASPAALGQASATVKPPPPLETKAKPSASPTKDQVKTVLGQAVKQIQTMADDAARSERVIRPPSPNLFGMRFEKELQADVVRALGRAQAVIGDQKSARATLQSALDVTNAVSSLEAGLDRATLFVQIAAAQVEAGDRDEARLTLRQALQAARSIAPESPFPFEPPPGMEFDNDPLAKKAEIQKKVAEIQAKAGDSAASETTFREAIESAKAITKGLNKVRLLLDIAQACPAQIAKDAWNQALKDALENKNEFLRDQAVELVLRAMVKAGQTSESLAIITRKLTGDFQNYGLWVFADAVASSHKPDLKDAIGRLKELALKAKFDRPSKKIAVFRRIAEAQARLGDFEGAYATIGEPHPVNDVQTFRATQSRVYVMIAVAEQQLRAKQDLAAKDTAQTAVEMIAPLPEEDAEAYFPLASLGDILARAGDVEGARRIVSAVTTSGSKVQILTNLAITQAKNNRLDDARASIRAALDATSQATSDSLWMYVNQSHGESGAMTLSFDPVILAHQTVVQAQAKLGDLDPALKMIADWARLPNGKFLQENTIEQIVSARLEAGDIAGALRAVELVPEPEGMYADEKAKMLESIAKQQAEHGDPADILAWTTKQTTPGAKLQILRGLANGVATRFMPKAKDSNTSVTRP